jgi:hypothetical protein
MEMKDFHSKTLNKTFSKIIFADNVTKNPWGDAESANPPAGGMMEQNDPHKSAVNEKETDIAIEPADGGLTVEQIYAKRADLKNKTIKVKGQIVKYNAGIMGKNWVHIQDGSGSNNDFDIVITTSKEYNIGDVVTFEGVLHIDKDFGSGYKYSVIIEDAKGVKELPQS